MPIAGRSLRFIRATYMIQIYSYSPLTDELIGHLVIEIIAFIHSFLKQFKNVRKIIFVLCGFYPMYFNAIYLKNWIMQTSRLSLSG